MKKFTVFFILALLFGSMFLVAVPPAYADVVSHDAGHPGGTWQNDGNAKIYFTQNDAYETHTVVQEPWQFLAHAWPSGFNQRVTAEVYTTDVDLGSGWVLDSSQPAYAQLIQKKDWINESYQKHWTGKDIHNTTWKKFYWTHESDTGHDYLIVTFPSVDLPSNKFFPGMFEIEIQVSDVAPWGLPYKEIRYKIWGEFTAGFLTDAQVTHKPDPTNPDTYSEITVTFGQGQWYVYYYYLKSFDDVNITHGNITGVNGFTPQVLVKYGPFYNGTKKTFRYNFTANSSTGLYAWILKNEWNGDVYNLMEEDVYNNYTATHNPDGSVNEIPSATITIGEKGKVYYMNEQIPITIHVDDDNSTILHVWVTIWYGNNMYFHPLPGTPTLMYWGYPLVIDNHSNKTMTITPTIPGQINVEVVVQDSNGALNQTYAQYGVEEGSGGGNNPPPSNNHCIKFPWEDTTNMILLLFGVILMFTRRPTLQVIGIALFFAAFVDWSCVGQQIQNGISKELNPFNWFKGVILR